MKTLRGQPIACRWRRHNLAVALLCLLWCLPVPVQAQSFLFQLDTTGLSAPSSGQNYGLYLALNDGGGSTSTTVTSSSFGFGGGSPVGTPTSFNGGASGDLSGTVRLTEMPDSLTSDFSQGFRLGSQIRFRIDGSEFMTDPGAPDRYLVALFDGSGSVVGTTADDGFSLATIDRTSSGFDIHRYGYTAQTGANAGQLVMAQVVSEPVPAPGAVAVCLLGSVGYGMMHRCRRAKASRFV
jgi:hypothetical protein